MPEEHDTPITQEDKLAVYALIQETVGRGQPVSATAVAQLMPLLVKLTRLTASRLEEFNSVCAAEKALRVVCDEAIAEVERLKAGWISVEKELPEPSQNVYYLALFNSRFKLQPGYYSERPGEVVSGQYLRFFTKNYSHWRRFPSPPEPAKKEETKS
jgi:hypothetical protein